MVELGFKSNLTMEEIEKNFKRVDFFSGVVEGLEDALAHANVTRSSEANTYNRPPNHHDDAQ